MIIRIFAPHHDSVIYKPLQSAAYCHGGTDFQEKELF